MEEVLQTGRKKLWEKEKLLDNSNFSFSHSVFERLVLQTCKNQGLFGRGLMITKEDGPLKSLWDKGKNGDVI